MEPIVSFGYWVRRRRLALDWTQATLAHQVGCSAVMIKKIEADERRPSRQLAKLLAAGLQIPEAEQLAFVQAALGEELVEHLHTAPSALPPRGEPKHNLPAQATPFVGRTTELAQISALLADSTCRLLTLVGPGGVGKTRLALQAASQFLTHFPDGVYLVELAPLSSAHLLASTLLDIFHLPQQTQKSPEAQLVHYLRNKQMLLLLDNFEHLPESVTLVKQLLQGASGVKLLVTSRERLKLQDEWLLPVSGLNVPANGLNNLDEQALLHLEAFSAVQLFVQRARRLQPTFALTLANATALVQICRLVEGMPLALELAAAWVQLMTCIEIAQEMARALDFLRAEWRDLPARQQSMRAVFDHSWQLLTPEEQCVLGQLAVFRGGFWREAAQTVTGATLPLLSALVDKSWLRAADGRFTLHELVRQFAEEKLASKDADAVCARHSAYYAAFMHARESALHGSHQKALLDEMLADVDNIRTGWHWAVAHDAVESIGQYLNSWQWIGEILHWDHDMAREFGEAANQLKALLARSAHQVLLIPIDLIRLVLARTLYCQARCYLYLQADQVQNLCEESLSYLSVDNLSLPYATARAYTKLLSGCTCYDQGRYAEAEAITLAVLADFQNLHDLFGVGFTMHNLAYVYYTSGDYQTAQHWWEQSLLIFNQLGEQWIKTNVLAMLGEVLCRRGDYLKAFTVSQEGYQIVLAFDLPTINYCMLGYVTYCLQEYDEADFYFRMCLNRAEELDLDFSRFVLNRWLANIAYQRGNYADAKCLSGEAYTFATKTKRPNDMAIALTGLGNATCALGEYSTAQQHFQAALTIFQETQALPDLMDTLVGISRFWLKTGKLAEAVQLLAFVGQHPSTGKETQTRAEEVLVELKTQLADAVFVNVQTAGAGMAFEAVWQLAVMGE
ncbi:MAG: AAA family ATPase [Caldilineaceae bacterium]